jgi:hypothetical protein
MRWTVKLLGTDTPVLVETEHLCESYDKALWIFYDRRAHKLGKNVRVVIIFEASHRPIAADATNPLVAFTRAIARGLDEKAWGGPGNEAHEEATSALKRVQHKLNWLGSSELCQM